VFAKHKAVILVHGCFWHRHRGCWWNTTPTSHAEFWATKFEQNVERDARNVNALLNLGWRVAVVWECSFRLETKEEVVRSIADWLKGSRLKLTLPQKPKTRPSPHLSCLS
jgi:DNA mismatch endonuclease (patch repair protein)